MDIFSEITNYFFFFPQESRPRFCHPVDDSFPYGRHEVDMAGLHQQFPVEVFCFASSVYWKDTIARDTAYVQIQQSIRNALGHEANALRFNLIDSDLAAKRTAERSHPLVLLVPMSGGVQPWMQTLSDTADHIALLHAYLPGFLPEDKGFALLNRNAHPSATDLYAWCRSHHKSIFWVHPLQELLPLVRGFQGARRLGNAVILKIGETEPWVINSCRDPQRFSSALGTRVIPISLDTLYARMQQVQPDESRASDWTSRAVETIETDMAAVKHACRVAAGFESLLHEYDADGLSIACFALIGAMDTTSCLAVSEFNDNQNHFAACEGDLDAAATMLLLKAIGADFVWVANPIIYGTDYIDLVHCTAPRRACRQNLSYRLLHHHESGRGVAPEVTLPEHQRVTLSRIGLDLTTLSLSRGRSQRIAKIPACHTQLRIHLDDPDGFLDRLLGTHVVMSYGDHVATLRHAARFLNLNVREDTLP